MDRLKDQDLGFFNKLSGSFRPRPVATLQMVSSVGLPVLPCSMSAMYLVLRLHFSAMSTYLNGVEYAPQRSYPENLWLIFFAFGF